MSDEILLPPATLVRPRHRATTIGWTDQTWNPVRGCEKISPGCKHCYTELFAERFRGVEGHPYEQGFDPRLVREQLGAPMRWRDHRRVFVNSMSDVFGEFVPDGYILDIFRIIAQCPQHTFQILTKRADRMVEWFARWADFDEPDVGIVLARGPEAVRAAHTSGRARLFADMIEGWGDPPDGAAYPTYNWMEGMRGWPTVFDNAWLGVSVEDWRYGLPRIDALRRVPAAVRFLSIEPLLEDLGTIDLTGIHWVIVGSESGPKARAMDPEWADAIVTQCEEAGVAVFTKQIATPAGKRAGDRKGEDPVHWPTRANRRRWPRQFPNVAGCALQDSFGSPSSSSEAPLPSSR